MKRFSFCDSSSVTLLFPPQPQPQSEREMMVYGSSGFQAMLEGLEEGDMAAEEERWEKKRRLRAEQVHALERVFEEDNKLEPDRKVRIARELGLEPRQVAIWFQNRRARFKTKQVERDFNLLKANYDSLHLHFNKLQQERDALLSELKGLKEKLLVEENSHSQCTTATAESNSSGGGSESELILDYSFNLQPLMAARSSAIYVQQPRKMEAEQQMVGGGDDDEECGCCNTSDNIFSLLDHPPNLNYWYCPTDYRYQ